MTKNITLDEVPDLIKDTMVKDISQIISSKKQLNGLCLQYMNGTDNKIYMVYFIKNVAGKIEECFFVTNDIIMDFRKPAKSRDVLTF